MDEVHLEPSIEIVMNAELETQSEMEKPVEEERAGKKQRVAEQTEERGSKEDKDFVSAEAKDIWTKVLADKGFICERGFGKLISHFSEIIEKRGWESFYAHTVPGFSNLAREFYANMVGDERGHSFRARSLGTLWG